MKISRSRRELWKFWCWMRRRCSFGLQTVWCSVVVQGYQRFSSCAAAFTRSPNALVVRSLVIVDFRRREVWKPEFFTRENWHSSLNCMSPVWCILIPLVVMFGVSLCRIAHQAWYGYCGLYCLIKSFVTQFVNIAICRVYQASPSYFVVIVAWWSPSSCSWWILQFVGCIKQVLHILWV